MGAVKHKDIIRNFFRRTPVADISSLKRRINVKSNYVSLMLNQMVKKKEVYRLTRGFYSLHNDPTLAVFCFKPAYLGLQEALSIHNLWEQETNTIVLTTKTVREGIRNIAGNKVILKRLPKKLFFGVEYRQYGDFYLPVSDIEKTLLDLIYFQQPIDKELLQKFKENINLKKLKQYLSYYDQKTKDKMIKSDYWTYTKSPKFSNI